jgi:hypothetical protein
MLPRKHAVEFMMVVNTAVDMIMAQFTHASAGEILILTDAFTAEALLGDGLVSSDLAKLSNMRVFKHGVPVKRMLRLGKSRKHLAQISAIHLAQAIRGGRLNQADVLRAQAQERLVSAVEAPMPYLYPKIQTPSEGPVLMRQMPAHHARISQRLWQQHAICFPQCPRTGGISAASQ